MLGRDLRGKIVAIGDVGDHNFGAFARECGDVMPADPLGAAGDDCGAPCEPHGISPERPRGG